MSQGFESESTKAKPGGRRGRKLRDLHENKVPVDWVSTSLNPRRLKVERSRNRADWYAISPQIPNSIGRNRCSYPIPYSPHLPY